VIGTLDGPTTLQIMPISEKDRKRRHDDHKKRGDESEIEQDDEFLACADLAVGDYVYVNEGVRQHASLWEAYRISRERSDIPEDTRKAANREKDVARSHGTGPFGKDPDDEDLPPPAPVRIQGHEDGSEDDVIEEP
jgi:hypothetical protein